jgi:toxin-antitoxin system PIN domain toxin
VGEVARSCLRRARVLIAVDTNILVYAHREDVPFHELAHQRISQLAEGGAAWAIPWPCVHEFLAIVTHPRIYNPPTPIALALDQIDAWLESPTLVLLSESEQHWSELRPLVTAGSVTGPRVHDARIAALCRQHGVRELWSADRDFSRFGGLTVMNPVASRN